MKIMMSTKLLKSKYSPEKKLDCFFTQQQIQVSNDGQYIFCQCAHHVNIIDSSSGNLVRSIDVEDDEVSSICLAPNNSSIVIGLSSSTIKHYELEDISKVAPRLLTSFKSYHRGPVLAMCWDPSSALLASGSSDGSARVWDLKQKFCTHSLKEARGVFRVLLFDSNLHDRPWIYGAAGEHIFVWLLEAGSSQVLSKLEGHDSAVTGLQLSHSRDLLISSGLDKVIIVWSLETFASKKIIPVFESLSGILLKPQSSQFFGVADNSKGNFVFTIGNNATPRIWDIDNGKEVWKASQPIITTSEKEMLLINYIYLIKDRNTIAMTTHDHLILIVDCSTMGVTKQLVGHNDEVLDAIFVGEEGMHTAVATNSEQMRIYEIESDNCRLVTGHTATVLALANHPNDRSLFGSSSHDNTARVWRLTVDGSAECLFTASGHTLSVGCLVLAQDFLLTGSKDGCIKRWRLDFKANQSGAALSFTRTQRTHEKDINGVAVSKNFSLVATASLDKTAKIWDAESLDLVGVLKGHKKGVWCVQFSPTAQIVATSSADATIKLWTLSDFSNVATFEGHEVSVLSVAWVSQGLQLVSAGADGLVKLWTLKNNLCVNTFDEHEGRAWALSVCEDGARMVTGGVDSTLIWWRDVTEQERIKEMEEKQRLVEEEQTLMNLLQKKRWSKALRLSLRLKQPFRGLGIMKALLDESPQKLLPVLRKLGSGEIETLLEFAVQWNTKTRNVREAQCVVNFLLKERLPEELEALPEWQTILEGLLPYTEKHLKRTSALYQSVSIINYMTASFSWETLGQIKDSETDEEEALLRTLSGKDALVSNGAKTDHSEDEESMASEEEEEEEDRKAPLESVDDIRSNFVEEEITTDTDEEEDDDDDEEEMDDEDSESFISN